MKIGERKIDEWPVVDKKSIQEVKIKVAIQINGKTKGVIEVKKDLPEKDLIKESQHDKKISKNLLNKEIIRIIFNISMVEQRFSCRVPRHEHRGKTSRINLFSQQCGSTVGMNCALMWHSALMLCDRTE